ncbi:MAG TPA: bifunctional precorrin-2 dehydrogenase/sirohydrochlorin ferrochelatase [Acidimicrobiales bacterium]|nr:bifunctional precorrin-2 dehydrogenase/sirohydrochlorin ferrochelatase [Acidimicrobiales bacterium]
MPLASPSYPIALLLDGRPCLVVGGGPVARRKIDGLLAAGARVTVVAPHVIDEIADLDVRVERRGYRAGEAASYFLVVTATGRPGVDRRVFSDADASGVLVNAADDLPGCSFILPAVVRRGPVSVAVSSDGTSPALATWLRDRVAALVGPEVAHLAELLGEARAALRSGGGSCEGRPWRELLDGRLAALVSEGDLGEARAEVARWTARELARSGGDTAAAGGAGTPRAAALTGPGATGD